MEAEDSGEADQNISAYAKLEFDQFSFFIQTLTLVVGRKAKRDDNVDVHLGTSKSISRVHAKIYYQFDAMSWEVEVLGKNGAFVNERYIAAGQICRLNNTDKLQIAEIGFSFLLPEGAAPPTNPTTVPNTQTTTRVPVVGAATTNDSVNKSAGLATPISTATPSLPLAPHHIMQRYTKPPESSLSTQDGSGSLPASKPVKTAQDVNQTTYKATTTAAVKSSAQLGTLSQINSTATVPTDVTPKKPRKKYTKKGEIKAEDSDVPNLTDVWHTAMSSSSRSESPELNIGFPTQLGMKDTIDQPIRTAEEQKVFDEETAAQHAAQLLHQERLTRQAMEEEEGLILPPPETNPTVIANLQKPTASYATMIYNAIMSHEKKKMTLAQIYSWICIYHPYYRYVQNGWQNSIRHNLSLNKAFKKVPRTDDEPGKGSFWAVDPDSEMLFEGGVYKKKPPRPAPTTPVSRGAPVVMKDGKLTLNPNYFAGGIQGKAEEVIQLLHTAVQDHIGSAATPEQVSQLARILALALATQLRLSAVNTSNRAQPVPQAARPAAQYYSATPAARVNANGTNFPNRSTVPATNPPYSMGPKPNGTAVSAAVRPAYSGNSLIAKPGTTQPITNAVGSQGPVKTMSTPVLSTAQSLTSRPTNGVTAQKASLPLPVSNAADFKRTEVPQVATPAKGGQQTPSTASTVAQALPSGLAKPAGSATVVGNSTVKTVQTPNISLTPAPAVSTAVTATAVQPQITSTQQPITTQSAKTDQSVAGKPSPLTPSSNVPNAGQMPAQSLFSGPQARFVTATPSPITIGSRVATGQTILPIPVLVAMGDRKSAGTPPILTNKRSLDDNISTEANKIQKGKHDETPSSVQRNVAPVQSQSTEDSKTTT